MEIKFHPIHLTAYPIQGQFTFQHTNLLFWFALHSAVFSLNMLVNKFERLAATFPQELAESKNS